MNEKKPQSCVYIEIKLIVMTIMCTHVYANDQFQFHIHDKRCTRKYKLVGDYDCTV